MQHETKYAQRKALLEAGLVDPPHGSYSTYSNYGCHCADCIAAGNARQADYRRRRREATERIQQALRRGLW